MHRHLHVLTQERVNTTSRLSHPHSSPALSLGPGTAVSSVFLSPRPRNPLRFFPFTQPRRGSSPACPFHRHPACVDSLSIPLRHNTPAYLFTQSLHANTIPCCLSRGYFRHPYICFQRSVFQVVYSFLSFLPRTPCKAPFLPLTSSLDPPQAALHSQAPALSSFLLVPASRSFHGLIKTLPSFPSLPFPEDFLLSCFFFFSTAGLSVPFLCRGLSGMSICTST